MDDLVRYGPWLVATVALLLAWCALKAAARARSDAAAVRAAVSAPPAKVEVMPPARGSTVLEERIGALEARVASLTSAVADAARPDPDDVAPMRPPVPTTVEPLVAPRSGWRMFP